MVYSLILLNNNIGLETQTSVPEGMSNGFSTEEVSAQNQGKASLHRRIRQSIAEEYPGLEPVLDDLLPKKAPLIVTMSQNHLNLVVVNNVPLFFNIRDGPYMPTLRLLHQYSFKEYFSNKLGKSHG
ncbi:malignant T-cell-amplified sequence 1 homolog [Cucurbita maxima]|uniref:Malignant T-cell-amplified sequence 1 homolog n=1 Tax=Cucurbita maxima TaxID=3661 RepID=A0A6J1KRT0_CUCMA|nr:malignant T-cell-amplified sequence 1 homolog [Cucurbita maxima]